MVSLGGEELSTWHTECSRYQAPPAGIPLTALVGSSNGTHKSLEFRCNATPTGHAHHTHASPKVWAYRTKQCNSARLTATTQLEQWRTQSLSCHHRLHPRPLQDLPEKPPEPVGAILSCSLAGHTNSSLTCGPRDYLSCWSAGVAVSHLAELSLINSFTVLE